jgi:hypothetical protein
MVCKAAVHTEYYFTNLSVDYINATSTTASAELSHYLEAETVR